jgi:hypothetical protein
MPPIRGALSLSESPASVEGIATTAVAFDFADIDVSAGCVLADIEELDDVAIVAVVLSDLDIDGFVVGEIVNDVEVTVDVPPAVATVFVDVTCSVLADIEEMDDVAIAAVVLSDIDIDGFVVGGIANDVVLTVAIVDDANEIEDVDVCVVVVVVHVRASHKHLVVGFVEQSCCERQCHGCGIACDLPDSSCRRYCSIGDDWDHNVRLN